MQNTATEGSALIFSIHDVGNSLQVFRTLTNGQFKRIDIF